MIYMSQLGGPDGSVWRHAGPSMQAKCAEGPPSNRVFRATKADLSEDTSMSITTAEDLFLDELKDIYSAEKQAIRAYPRVAKAVSSEELKQALQKHLEQTKGQLERLDRVFEILEKRAGGKTCEAMKGLLEEAQESIEEIEQGPVLDVAIIAAAQRIEHYEIAAYGTVATLAEAMRQDEIKNLLAETLNEEKQTYELLTQVSQQVNAEALCDSEEDEEESDDEDEESEDDDEEEDTDEDDEDAPSKKSASKKSAAKKSAAKKSSKK